MQQLFDQLGFLVYYQLPYILVTYFCRSRQLMSETMYPNHTYTNISRTLTILNKVTFCIHYFYYCSCYSHFV